MIFDGDHGTIGEVGRGFGDRTGVDPRVTGDDTIGLAGAEIDGWQMRFHGRVPASGGRKLSWLVTV